MKIVNQKMQIENEIICTSVDELKELMRHITLQKLEGRINLKPNGNDIEVSQPANPPVDEYPKLVSLGYDEPQPTDNSDH